MTPTTSLDQLNTEQLCSLAAQLLQNIERLDKEVLHHKTRNQQLIHEIPQFKRHRFAKRAESFGPDQASLLDDQIDTDIPANEAEFEILAPKSASSPARLKLNRTALPAEFPCTLIHHEPENPLCICGSALKRWAALSRYLDDGAESIDNNGCENQIRPWAPGCKNWLFTGSLRSGKRAAAPRSLIQSAKLNGHDPHACLKDVFTRLPTQRASEIQELLTHRSQPT